MEPEDLRDIDAVEIPAACFPFYDGGALLDLRRMRILGGERARFFLLALAHSPSFNQRVARLKRSGHCLFVKAQEAAVARKPPNALSVARDGMDVIVGQPVGRRVIHECFSVVAGQAAIGRKPDRPLRVAANRINTIACEPILLGKV